MNRRKREKAALVEGSERAKLFASVILEVFAGIRGPTEASEAMGVSPNRYYELEARGLTGMIAALEPLPRGRQKTKDAEIEELTRENERLGREVARLTSLVRAARRTVGVKEPSKKGKGGVKRRKPRHRGKKVVALLRRESEDETATST